jgi:hypothetical protein
MTGARGVPLAMSAEREKTSFCPRFKLKKRLFASKRRSLQAGRPALQSFHFALTAQIEITKKRRNLNFI